MSPRTSHVSVGYRWHLRERLGQRGIWKTTELVPLLESRGVELSREQVYRLVAKVPERLSLTTLAALCDILDCSPADLIEPMRDSPERPPRAPARGVLREITPRRARVAPGSTR